MSRFLGGCTGYIGAIPMTSPLPMQAGFGLLALSDGTGYPVYSRLMGGSTFTRTFRVENAGRRQAMFLDDVLLQGTAITLAINDRAACMPWVASV